MNGDSFETGEGTQAAIAAYFGTDDKAVFDQLAITARGLMVDSISRRKTEHEAQVNAPTILNGERAARIAQLADIRGDPNRRFKVDDLRDIFLCPVCLAPTQQLFKQLRDGEETGIAVITCSVNHAEKIIAGAREEQPAAA